MTVSFAPWEPAHVVGDARREATPRLRTELQEAQPFLLALARRLCRDEANARDLVQDTFEHALRKHDAEPANARAYLAVILKNLFIDRCRRLAAQPGHVAIDHDPPASEPEPEPTWSAVTIDDVRAALEKIERDFRRVYEMHVFEQRSYDEIARELGIQRVTVGTRLTRTRQRLRALLAGDEGSER